MTSIVIDGNISSGKSTLIEQIFNDFPDIKVIPEDIESFKKWLDLYYTNMSKFALGFQMEVLLSHIKNKKFIKNYIVTERSSLSCIEVFGKYLLNSNILNEDEQELCNKYNREFGWMPDIVIYIDTSPITCFNRLKSRNRDGESNISLNYLESIHELYNNLYNSKDNPHNYKLYKIDGSKNKEEVYHNVKNILNSIIGT